jgi:hypothetical protein
MENPVDTNADLHLVACSYLFSSSVANHFEAAPDPPRLISYGMWCKIKKKIHLNATPVRKNFAAPARNTAQQMEYGNIRN